jgi:hypothetical protein
MSRSAREEFSKTGACCNFQAKLGEQPTATSPKGEESQNEALFFEASHALQQPGSGRSANVSVGMRSVRWEDKMIRASRNYSRRRFLQSETAGVTATILEASTAGGAAAQAGVQSRIVKKSKPSQERGVIRRQGSLTGCPPLRSSMRRLGEAR